MRDWSAKWHTVEPEQGTWDFSKTDPQIDRVVKCELSSLMLLPFASATWSSAADMDLIRKEAQGNQYHERRYVVACPARDPALFRNYVARTVERYRDRVDFYEIMNEPLYTTYAVPHRFGYDMQDYLQILRDAYETIKANQPSAQVIGGIGTWVDRDWVQQFIDADGLRWCDAMDIHLYPVTIPPEVYGKDLAECRKKMRDRGQEKPIWLTEFGCYADDEAQQRGDQKKHPDDCHSFRPQHLLGSFARCTVLAVTDNHLFRRAIAEHGLQAAHLTAHPVGQLAVVLFQNLPDGTECLVHLLGNLQVGRTHRLQLALVVVGEMLLDRFAEGFSQCGHRSAKHVGEHRLRILADPLRQPVQFGANDVSPLVSLRHIRQSKPPPKVFGISIDQVGCLPDLERRPGK
jgi:hypothetical protein